MSSQHTSVVVESGAVTSVVVADDEVTLVEVVDREVTILGVGEIGPVGPVGPPGAAATIQVGTTTTVAPSSPASVTNIGTSSAAVFDFDIPQGVQGTPGAAATVQAGTTTTGAPGSNAVVVNSGTSSAAVFDFTIPRGDVGQTGPQGLQGVPGAAATVATGTTTTGAPGSNASVVNSGTSSAAVLDFTIPRGDKGDTGDPGDAATIAVGTVTTVDPADPATVTNVGTSSAAVFDFEIPQGVKGDQGDQGPQGATGPTGPSGVVSVTAPITNSGTSTSAALALSTGNGLSTSGGTLAADFGTTSTKVASGDRGLPTGGTTGQVLAKSSGSDYAVGWVGQHPPLDTPYPSTYRIGPWSGIAAAATANQALDYTQFLLHVATTVDGIGIRIRSSPAADTNYRLGLYTGTPLGPTSLIVDAGLINCATISTQIATIAPVALVPGIYYVAAVRQGPSAVNVDVNNSVLSKQWLGTSWSTSVGSPGNSPGLGFRDSATVSGTLPVTASPVIGTSNLAQAFLRVA